MKKLIIHGALLLTIITHFNVHAIDQCKNIQKVVIMGC